MKAIKTKKIYKMSVSRKLSIQHVCEVGVYMPETSSVVDFILHGAKATLVEPDTASIKAIQLFFKDAASVKLFPYAIYDYSGSLELVRRKASTYVSLLPNSPAILNDRYQPVEGDKFSVQCKTFDEIDDGTIDLLAADTEGCEWYVIKNLRSRPKVISLETHGKLYVNPFMSEINEWMKENKYSVWYKGGTDTVYCRNGVVKITFLDKLRLNIQEAAIAWAKYKRIARNKLFK